MPVVVYVLDIRIVLPKGVPVEVAHAYLVLLTSAAMAGGARSYIHAVSAVKCGVTFISTGLAHVLSD